MECETKQTALAAGENPACDIEEYGRRRGTRLQHFYAAGLLDDEQAS
jgi:hypothetical protein